jgi:CheY-like chemotaxis protein
MLVEDDPITTMLTEMVIKRAPRVQRVTPMKNGLSALRELQKRIHGNEDLPDLILLDINMPVMDGWDFLTEVGKLAPLEQVPVVMLTSSVDPADIARASQSSRVKAYLSKPVNVQALEKVLADL